MIALLMWLPAAPAIEPERYDAVIWNVYRNRDGRYATQLLVCTFTRRGLRVEDWRAPKREPAVRKVGRSYQVHFTDDRDGRLRCIHARTYSVLHTAFDYELKNRERHPLSHRRPLRK